MAAAVGDNLLIGVRGEGLGLQTLLGVVILGTALAPVVGWLEIENQ